jgi:hypothetical protein
LPPRISLSFSGHDGSITSVSVRAQRLPTRTKLSLSLRWGVRLFLRSSDGGPKTLVGRRTQIENSTFASYSPCYILRPMRSPAIKTLLKLTFCCLPFIAFFANFTETRSSRVPREVTAAPTASIATPIKVTILKSHRSEAAGLTRFPGGPVHFPAAVPTVREVKAYVQSRAVQRGVDPELALWIVRHESSFNPRARGDGEASRGLWQISKIYHPEVTDAEAFDVRSSTEWSLGRIRSGNVNEWSSYRNCRSLYEDCPY